MTSKWKEYKLGELCSNITSGGTPKSTNNAYYNNGNIPWLNTKEVKFNRIYNTEKCISELGLNNSSAKWIKPNNVIVAMYGATAGNVAINKIPLTTNQACCNLEIDKSIAHYEFIYYYLLNNYNILSSMANGGAQQNLNSLQIKNFEISIPTFKTQQKIAKVLSAIDDKIELNNSINNNLEQQAQAIFKSWFVDFEPFGNTMPLDWNIGKLEDIVEFLNGYAFKSSELLNSQDVDCYDVFKQGHINRGGGFNPSGTKSWYPKDKAKNLEKYILKKGDVLMAMTDMKDNVAILGNTALMGVDNKYIVNQRVGLLRAQNDYNISYPFIYILTNSTDFLIDLRKRANSGVQVNLSSAEIKNSDVVIATKDINSKFDNIVKPFFEQIFNNNLENSRLIQLRDTLLPKLMNGEIDVSKVDIDDILENQSADKLLFSEDK